MFSAEDLYAASNTEVSPQPTSCSKTLSCRVIVSLAPTATPQTDVCDGCAVQQTQANPYYLFDGYAHLAAGLACGLAGLAAGMAIGIVGDAGVR